MAALGELIRQAREAKGLSLQDVSSATKIREHILTALERESYADLPAPVFVRGFLRTLARQLGLNTDQLLALYAQVSPEAPPDVPEKPARDERPTPAPPAGLNSASLAAGIVAVVVMAGIVWGGSRVLEGLALPGSPPAVSTAAPAAPTANATTALVSTPDATRAPPPTPSLPAAFPTATPTPTASALQKFEIKLEVTARSWLKIEADGAVVYEGILEAGDSKTFTARQRITMRSGNAGGVNAIVNGQSQGPLGGAGDVVDRQWVINDKGVIATTTPTWANPPNTPTPTSTPQP